MDTERTPLRAFRQRDGAFEPLMAGERTHSTAEKATHERAGRRIRDSRLRAPARRVLTVERQRLLRLIAADPDARIVLISASAGYGKSTLAAQWSIRCQRPVAWLSLERGDNDPLIFLDSLVHALDRVAPVDPDLFDELSSVAPRVDDIVLPALADELARSSPLELILDDIHELSQSRSLDVISSLLEEIPSGSQVVLVTRADPELHLSHHRVAGDLLEIRADKLAFDADETNALAASIGARLSERTLANIHERTEGWPAGVALALRAADDDSSGDAVAAGIQGNQREVADYLFEAVLARETEEHRTFLLGTSILRRMTAPLCDTVLGTTGSSGVLSELEQSNSFVVPLDDERGWYRYHHLFGELLRSELDRREPGLASHYLTRAAEWHERNGTDPGEAFRCAHEAGDLERAGRIALASAAALIGRGRLETMRLWLLECTDAELGADPQLALAAAWVHFFLGDAEKAERFARDVERGDLDIPSADGATSLRSALANFRTALAPRGIHQMLADAEYVYAAEYEARTRWLFGGCRAIGTANILLGRPDAAIEAFTEAQMLAGDRPEMAFPRVICLAYLAFAAAEKGTWPEARKWAQEAKALVDEYRLEQTLPGALAFAAKATVLVHDGDFDRAVHELAAARRVRHFLGATRWLTADMDLRWGNLSLDLGERLVAIEHAAGARAALHGYPDPGALPARLSALESRIQSAAELHLTPAELRIVPFLPTHLSVKEIAARLHVSPATVKTHLSQIYAKLGGSTRSEAVEKMEQLGLHVSRTEPERSAGT
ncbi:MAG: LuxR C-terminal-related transcriptional regulator [Gaiellaceae bacterium]